MCDNDRMKTYSIPVTHTATTVVDHKIEAKSMQDAMFQLGKAIQDAPDPFHCVTNNTDTDVETTMKAGTPQIVADDTPAQTPLDTGI